ncbi:uncharacterized protein LOC103104642 [Monodelphis domestica]|uniref:uncharacterized protein LOC103104642 n=1 Tax=Monodelphis domestica TaxID=13616 RepID=UPI0024E240D2|nr:uncharacterized protein LOC103104642 [Monodelphis domestica]
MTYSGGWLDFPAPGQAGYQPNIWTQLVAACCAPGGAPELRTRLAQGCHRPRPVPVPVPVLASPCAAGSSRMGQGLQYQPESGPRRAPLRAHTYCLPLAPAHLGLVQPLSEPVHHRLRRLLPAPAPEEAAAPLRTGCPRETERPRTTARTTPSTPRRVYRRGSSAGLARSAPGTAAATTAASSSPALRPRGGSLRQRGAWCTTRADSGRRGEGGAPSTPTWVLASAPGRVRVRAQRGALPGSAALSPFTDSPKTFHSHGSPGVGHMRRPHRKPPSPPLSKLFRAEVLGFEEGLKKPSSTAQSLLSRSRDTPHFSFPGRTTPAHLVSPGNGAVLQLLF